ncbi:efflux transporter outer membrane subunit [Janthinobacterium agaricidamnosum]|uniref:Efflux transporter, outer membrane factor (OMF) lipo, NodT family protein n=1 Tax=Janthinobacterium agaricidamnosum NBRC 102515 = DSM 9628 TaxID=1349767 RepID=W0V2U7_9BURK|nr:efflux transporter outer membrane subunit [Janthinobacterium agaricidamnosum]CDG81678.1 efflux transporter, outer membrane factor (OMF) lipo, NodT family protein [Janthinobacterium agaricidamnosum NBRC 102515 = DSM 9628]
MMRRGVVACTMAAMLAGCAANAPPAPPSSLQVPAEFRSRAGPAANGPALERWWWQAFGDPVLGALVDRALANNGDLLVARARVAEYRARLAQADSSRRPALSFDSAPTRARTLAYNGEPYVSNVFQAELQAGYEIDVWGRLARLSDAAAASYRAEQASADAAALSIAASVAAGYLNLRGLDAQLELAQATLTLRQQSRDLARRQFEVGYSSQLEWLQAQSEYHAAAELVPQLQRAIFEQENALAILAGGNPGPVARGIPLADLNPPPVPAGLPSDLLRRRPDIARAELNLLASNDSLAAIRDQLLPSFKLTAAGGVQAATLTTFLNAPLALWKLTGIVAGPIFDGGRVQAQTDAAAARRDQLAHAYEDTVRGAFAEADNGIGALARLREQAQENDARRATAADTLRIARNRYRNGYASYLEELDAQRTLYSADVGRLQLKTRMLVASVDLYRAMGGGWAAPPPIPAP